MNRHIWLEELDDDVSDDIKEKIYKTLSGENEPEFMILTEAEEKQMFEIMSKESDLMENLYENLFSLACELMRSHAPKSAVEQIDRIVFQTLFFRTVDMIGRYAFKTGELPIPDFDGPAAMYIRENTKEAETSVNQGVLVV